MGRTKRDLVIQRKAIHFMVQMVRQGASQTMRDNVARFYAQRKLVTYDFSPIPCPIWHGTIEQFRT
jgi:hypothetical protein